MRTRTQIRIRKRDANFSYPPIYTLNQWIRKNEMIENLDFDPDSLLEKGLNHFKEAQDDKDDRKDDQNMNPITSFGEVWADIPAESTECPQDHKNYYDCPQHDISPFE